MTDTDLITAGDSAPQTDAPAVTAQTPPAPESQPAESRGAEQGAGAGGSLSTMVLPELRALANRVGVKGTSGMRKGDLIAAIRDTQSGGNGGQRGEAEHEMRIRAQVVRWVGEQVPQAWQDAAARGGRGWRSCFRRCPSWPGLGHAGWSESFSSASASSYRRHRLYARSSRRIQVWFPFGGKIDWCGWSTRAYFSCWLGLG